MNSNTLTPENVFHFFREICRIPRPSKHEEKIIRYLTDFATARKLEYETDEKGNVLIRKPATPGHEQAPGVVLQSHVDMVTVSRKEIDYDPLNDPIQTIVEGEWLQARGTTLGADNGLGVAAQLAVLDSNDIAHGPLECLFTVDEETSLGGAYALRSNWLQSPYLINLDSEDEGEIFVGCAGGNDLHATFAYTPEPTPENYFFMRFSIEKLIGGHSGSDIHKHRANALKLISSFLGRLLEKYDLRLCSLQGGEKHNAIPFEAIATAAIPMKDKESVRVDFNIFSAEMEREYHITEPHMRMSMESESPEPLQLPNEIARRLIRSIVAAPHGVYGFSQDDPAFVHTSNNLAIVTTGNGQAQIHSSQRSDSAFSLEEITRTVAAVFALAGATVRTSDGYPGWTPVYDSHLLHVAQDSYRALFGQEAQVKTIHAGLECGLISEKYPAMEMISFGPTIRGEHTPEEKLHIPSVGRFWKHLVHVLGHL